MRKRRLAARSNAPAICASTVLADRFSPTASVISVASERREQGFGLGVVSEGLADVDEQIAIARSENETSPQLKWVLPQAVLAMSILFGARTRHGVVAAKQMQQVSGFQFCGAVCVSIRIDEQRKSDSCLLAKGTSIVHIAQTDGSQRGPCLLELAFVCAQLRDMFTAENSTVVAQKDDDGRMVLPKRAQLNLGAPAFRQHDVRQSRTKRFGHGGNCIGGRSRERSPFPFIKCRHTRRSPLPEPLRLGPCRTTSCYRSA